MTGDEDDIEVLVRRADPVRTAPGPLDPDLVERIVAHGPAGRPRMRPVVLAAVAATILVTVGAFVLRWSLGADPGGSAVPATSQAIATPTGEIATSSGRTSSRASQCATGWKVSRLPAGYQLSDPDETRRNGWVGSWEKADGRFPVVMRAVCGTLGQGDLSTLRPNYRVGSRPAHLSPPDAPALWLHVQQKPGVVLELSSYPPDQAPLSVVRTIAAALTDDPSVPAVSAPTDTCTALLRSYRVTPPAGFRLVSERRDDEVGTRSLRFQRNSALVSVEIACPGHAADLGQGGVAAQVPYGTAELTTAGGKPQVVWQAEPKLIVFVDPIRGDVTREDVLAFLAGTRRS